MINIILYDDDIKFLEMLRKTISSILFSFPINYKISCFNKYNKELETIISSELSNKIYILDLEVDSCSGLDLARNIRKKDWSSPIIVLTAHYELELLSYQSKILLLDFISKFDSYEVKLKKSIKIAIDKVLINEGIVIKNKDNIYRVNYKDILYIYFDSSIRKTVFVFCDKEIKTNKTLKAIYEDLGKDFIYSHKACIVNKRNIKSINLNERTIFFNNNKSTKLFSRNHIKDVKRCSL